MADFVLLRPWWLILLLLPLIFVYVDFAKHYKLQNFINEDIINYLKPKKNIKNDFDDDEDENINAAVTSEEQKMLISKPKLWKKFGWLVIPYFFAVVALCGPAIPQDGEGFQNDENWIWVVDSSLSMLATDLKPNRFQRARFSLIELLHASKDHRHIGIVAFTNESYVVAPPTDDASSLLYLLQELDPAIMPREAQGSNPLEGLKEARKILDQDHKTPGNILLVLDDVKTTPEEVADLIAYIKECPYPVYIYAIGTPSGSPIPVNETFVRDKNGNTVMAQSNFELIHKVAKDTGSQVYFEMNDQAPLLEKIYSYKHSKYKVTEKSKYTHKDIGYFFMLACLITAVCFIRNYFFVIALAFTLFTSSVMYPQDAMAADEEVSPQYIASHPNEYGHQLYMEGKYEEALKYLTDHFWRGNAYYRLGRYDKALPEYEAMGNDAEAKYNIGNCFAHMQSTNAASLDNAILAYDQALELNPEHADASMNKTVIIEYLRKLNELARARQEAQIKEARLNGLTSASNDMGYAPLPTTTTGTLLQRRMALQQSKKTYKITEQKW